MTAPTTRQQVHLVGNRRAWVVWLTALAVYVLAIFHRTSLSVAGLIAADRFHISAGQLATFTVVQLGVYASMQVPVGVLLDRFGSKRLMLVGLALMSIGQAWFAIAGSFGVGVAARVLIGAGDAMIFTSVMRLVMLWFNARQIPVVTQLTGVLGQIGAIAAATPLAASLSRWGWTPSFTAAALLGVAFSIGLFLIVKDSPYVGDVVEPIQLGALRRSLAEVWGNPGTRLGLWAHFTAQFATTVFAMLWGHPFLVAGHGVAPRTASNMIMLMTVTAMVAGPLFGRLAGSHPFRRSQGVLAIVALTATAWAIVLLWPGRAPLWVLVVLVIVTALGGPGSMVGFDLARSFHRSSRLGRVTGVVNVGGFIASLMMIAVIGLVLDIASDGPGTYQLNDFRLAFAPQFILWGVGAIQIVRYRRKGLALIESYPGALDALRAGDALLPGLSLDD